MKKQKNIFILLITLVYVFNFYSCYDGSNLRIPCTKVIEKYYNANRTKLLNKSQVLCKDTTVLYGSQISYYENGKIIDINFYLNNMREGIQTTYDTSGNLTSVELRKHDILDGVTTFYWTNGKVYQERKYNNGKLLQVDCRDTLGNKLFAGLMSNGNGSVYFHNSNQQLLFIQPYKDGLENGFLTIVDSMGNRTVDSTTHYVNGKLVGE